MQMLLSKPGWLNRRYAIPLSVVIIVGVVGVILLLVSHASTPYASINADKGTLSGIAVSQTDSTASDGKSVEFGGINPSHSAVKAYSFTDSVGVNTHLYYLDTAYGDSNSINSALAGAGIKHIRDGIAVPINLPYPTYMSDVIARFKAVQNTGVGVDLQIGGCPNSPGTYEAPAQWVSTIANQMGFTNLDSVELTNEIDGACGSNWLINAVSFSQALGIAMRANPVLKSVPVIGPSFVLGGSPAQMGDLSGYIDYGNIHPYTNAQPPTPAFTDSQKAYIAPVSGSKPIWATETGNDTASLASTDLNGSIPVPPSVQAVYTVNTYLEHFVAGISRTYLYELVDEKSDAPNNVNLEEHFGLLNYDWTPKPSYTALKNTLGLLNDSNTSFSPGSLNYTLSGSTANTHSLLMRKTNGEYWLAVWQADSIYNQATRVLINPVQVPLKLNLDKSVSSLTSFQPIISANPVATSANVSSFSFVSSPNVTLIQIKP